MRLSLVLVFAGFLGCVRPPAPAPPVPTAPAALHAYQSDGPIVLLDDVRLDDTLRAEAWPWGGVPPEEENSDHWKAFTTQPMELAAIRLLGSEGRVLDETRLEQPLARLARAEMAGLPPTWLVTEDFSVGMGSYNGPITSFLQVRDGKLHWVEATGARQGRLQVMESLKTAWKVDPARPTDILHASCRPDESGGFVVTYERLHYQEGVFQSQERKVSGFLEFETEESFPATSEFPA